MFQIRHIKNDVKLKFKKAVSELVITNFVIIDFFHYEINILHDFNRSNTFCL